jgi:two-component system, cell cycle sensor histidine kinase and response regulator CckA
MSSAEILVVDDDPAVCTLMQRILETHGYFVSTAHGGAEALRILARPDRGFRLLVTDVLMPDMPGPALARAATDCLPGLPVLYVSGNVGDYSDSVPAARSLTKPFTPAQFLARVGAIVPEPGRQLS